MKRVISANAVLILASFSLVLADTVPCQEHEKKEQIIEENSQVLEENVQKEVIGLMISEEEILRICQSEDPLVRLSAEQCNFVSSLAQKKDFQESSDIIKRCCASIVDENLRMISRTDFEIFLQELDTFILQEKDEEFKKGAEELKESAIKLIECHFVVKDKEIFKEQASQIDSAQGMQEEVQTIERSFFLTEEAFEEMKKIKESKVELSQAA